LGLAYAPKGTEENLVVASAPEASKPAASGASKTPPPAENTQVAEAPPATIVVAEAPPPKEEVAKAKAEGIKAGKEKGSEKVAAGQKMDPNKKIEPKIETEKRPYSIEDLRKQQIKEMEDMMDEMRGKVDAKKKGGNGAGLW
jgi:hypothetical protein